MEIKKDIKDFMLSPVFLWITGLVAFIWILFRSSMNPKRLTYPCQQSAFPLASMWVIAYVPIFQRFFKSIHKKRISLIIVFATIILAGFVYKFQDYFQAPKSASVPPVWVNEDALSDIYVYNNIPVSSGSLAAGNASVPDEYLSDSAIDSLIYMMNFGKTPFFKTSEDQRGIVGKDDIVLMKCNFQWRHRLGTNTDRIKGVIWQILNHPEGFDGEILICDNEECIDSSCYMQAGFNDYSNNSDDEDQSIVDVINTFKSKGYPVDYYVWDSLNTKIVSEYDQGDMSDGYIFNPQTLTSYPKFRTPRGNQISFSLGIWDNDAQVYNKGKLTTINFPVLKAHDIAGATIALKNYIGVMNTTKADEWFGRIGAFHMSYCFSPYALVAREIEIAWPDLNIIDATYVATVSNSSFTSNVVHQQTILASTDPVASSWYAAKYILTPMAKYPSRTNPDLNNGGSVEYSTILRYWYDYLKDSTDYTVTKKESEISVYSLNNLPDNIISARNQNISDGIKIFPNPFDEKITIITKEAEKDLSEILIVDFNGRIVFSDKMESRNNSITIHLDFLVPGSYILQLNLVNNQVVRKQIVKK